MKHHSRNNSVFRHATRRPWGKPTDLQQQAINWLLLMGGITSKLRGEEDEIMELRSNARPRGRNFRTLTANISAASTKRQISTKRQVNGPNPPVSAHVTINSDLSNPITISHSGVSRLNPPYSATTNPIGILEIILLFSTEDGIQLARRGQNYSEHSRRRLSFPVNIFLQLSHNSRFKARGN